MQKFLFMLLFLLSAVAPLCNIQTYLFHFTDKEPYFRYLEEFYFYIYQAASVILVFVAMCSNYSPHFSCFLRFQVLSSLRFGLVVITVSKLQFNRDNMPWYFDPVISATIRKYVIRKRAIILPGLHVGLWDSIWRTKWCAS